MPASMMGRRHSGPVISSSSSMLTTVCVILSMAAAILREFEVLGSWSQAL